MTRENTVNVPREPTEAMLRSAYATNEPFHPRAIWEAMLSAAPLHEGEGEPVAWLYTENKWKDGPRHRLSTKRQGVSDEDANEFEITETPIYAAPPPSVEVFGSSSLKGEDTHRDADGAVVADPLSDAREAFLNMVADAKKWEFETDGEYDDDGRPHCWCTVTMASGHSQVQELCDALGMTGPYDEALEDRIARYIEGATNET